MSTNGPPKSTLDGLPKQFLSAMRTLFDIMDDKQTGFIKFSDIESRWQDEGTQSLPKGVLEALRKVTPPNGMLSFERFCAGLKICLLRNRGEKFGGPGSTSNYARQPGQLPQQSVPLSRSQSSSNVPVSRGGIESSSGKVLASRQSSSSSQSSYTMSVRPNNVITSQHRAISMPYLAESSAATNNTAKTDLQPPERPELRGYKSDLKINAPDFKDLPLNHPWYNDGKLMKSSGALDLNRNLSDSNGKFAKMGFDLKDLGDIPHSLDLHAATALHKPASRRKEPRRHTLTNGIDYNMLKRMKQLEQEKDVLLEGLEKVERAREWYHKKVTAVQDKMKYIGKGNTYTAESSMEAHQERLNFQRARIVEVNQHLTALIESSEKGFPLHMNLAVPCTIPLPNKGNQPEPAVRRLKEKVHFLTEDVGRKSDRITQLEREKTALIRELFQIRSQRREPDEASFM